MDNSSREQFQSETGRGIDSLVRPSSLFYTVSGHHLNKGKYVHEILGCPSIIKPSFRDLPGCTRLSVGVPSQSYRPLDKLNKTMGKSTTSNQGKRHTRGESKFPPIKVNAKIRHIYSHLTSSEPPTPSQPQIATISTQTDFEIFSEQSEEQEKPNESAKRDAFTCISPPPMSNAFGFVESTSPADKLPAIPPSYLSKLEDLEKITGHIVIQRFFTRADEAFGCWLEKQLGVNNKSVGVDTSDNTDNIEILEDSAVNEGTSSTPTTLNVPTTPCKVDDGVKCECFLELLKASEENEVEESSKKEVETSLDPFEQDLLSQCIAYEILGDGSVRNAKKLSGRKGLVQQEKVCEEGEENSSVQIEETESKKRLSQASIDREVTEELIKNMDQLISELPSEDYVQRNPEGDFESKKEFKAAVEKVIKAKESGPGEPGDQQDVSSEVIEANLSDSLQNETETSETKEDSVIEQLQGSLNEEIVPPADRPCIPDVIDVADLSASDRFSLESEMSQVALESQSKVVEYLGKIDPSAAAAMDDHEEGMDDFLRPSDEISQGECSGQTDERKELKRSLSVDSCIGTESSGETKHGHNDSGILLDSGRAVYFDGVSETTRSTVAEAEESSRIENSTKLLQEETRNDLASKSTEEPKDSSVEKPKSPTRTLSNRSVDESILSPSEEQSSAIQRGGSDGDTEDADQSDSDEELSSLSLRRARRASSSGISGMPIVTEETEDLVVVDDDDEEEEVDEQEPLDQFDAMIESHEREKRLLRPICRKRNVSTQTTKSVESSLISSATSRSTTATSSTNSSFDLEFVSKKYMTNVSPDGASGGGEKRRAYLPSGASSLNILNMKFSLGRDFESEFSIRIPNKPSPTGSGSSVKGPHENDIPSAVNTPRSSTTTRVDRGTQALGLRPSESDLRSLWKDVKSKMECRVGTVDTQFPSVSRERDLLVTGNRMKLIAYDDVLAPPQDVQTVDHLHLHSHSPLPPPISSSTSIVTQEREERLKRSLKRLKKILDA